MSTKIEWCEADRARCERIAHWYTEGLTNDTNISCEHHTDIEMSIEAAIKMFVTGEGEDGIE